LTDEKYQRKKFFVFANTCTTLELSQEQRSTRMDGRSVSTRIPIEEPSEVVIHVRLKGSDPIYQQRTIGGIGTNLLFACYWYFDQIDDFISSSARQHGHRPSGDRHGTRERPSIQWE
jgi:hypothetical protein